MRRWRYLNVGAACGLLLVFCAQAQAQIVQSTPVPSAQTNGRVNVVVVSGTTAYIGGTFTSVRPAGDPLGTGEVARNHAAAIDLITGALLPWNPQPNGVVTSIAVNSGNGDVYLGGSFGKVGPKGTSRKDIAEVDGTTGTPIAGFKVSGLNKEVQAIYYDAADNELDVGGAFTAPAAYVAQFDPTSGAINTTWAPVVDGAVEAITETQDGTNKIVLGGDFQNLDGVAHVAIGAVDPILGTTALPWTWSGPPHGGIPKYYFNIVALTADSTGVYAAGTGNGGTALKFDSAGNMQYQVALDGNAVGVAVMDGELYVAGHFNYYCGNQMGFNNCGQSVAGSSVRHHLLAVDSTLGTLQSWNPSVNTALGTFALAAGSGYVATGGEFTKLAGKNQQGFGEFSE